MNEEANCISMLTRLYVMEVEPLFNDNIYKSRIDQVSDWRRDRINQYRFRKDKCLSLAAGILLDTGLQELGLRERDMEYCIEQHGKSYFTRYPDIGFSLSHSGNAALAAISVGGTDTLPGEFHSMIGCDIERIKDKNLAVAKRFFTESEFNIIESCNSKEEQQDKFFRLWTLKESFVKMIGLGLSLEFNKFTINFAEKCNNISIEQDVYPDPCYLNEFNVLPGYKIACCCNNPLVRDGDIKFVNYPID